MFSTNIEKYLMKTFGLNDSNGYKATKLTEGLSGADVYILEILNPRRHRYRGIHILKVIDTAGRWYDKEDNEVVKSKRIYTEAIKFQKHLVKVEMDAIIDDKLVLILSYAFHSEISSVSMAQVRLDNKLDMLEQISYDLLAKLNADAIEFTDNNEVIENLCSYRLEENGNFRKRLRLYIYELNKSSININGSIFPNPHYYLGQLKKLLKDLHIQYVKGITHGDMHQKNILMLKNNSQYVVIDYDSCEKKYLLFDQAYLELNSYMQAFNEWNLETWLEGMNYAFQVDDKEGESAEFAGVAKIENRIRRGVERWYNENVPGLMDSFHVQLQLARIAAGINYFSKSGIDNQAEHLKYLIYICYGLRALFALIDYKWDKGNASRLINKQVDSEYAKLLWNECGKLRNEYIKVLITDDDYELQKYQTLSNIGEIDWKLIVDVGRKVAPDDLLTAIVPCIKEFNSIRFIGGEEQASISVNGNTNLFQLKNGEHVSLFDQWTMFRKKFVPILKSICSNEPLKSVLFVIDFHNKSCIRDRFIEMLWEENLIRKGSRFVCLGLTHDLPLQTKEIEEKNIKYFEHEDMNLEDMVKVIDEYGLHRQRISEEIQLPSIESLDGRLTKEMWNDYNSVVEIIYPGIENSLTDYTNGEEFYKGNEITWLDLSQKKDIEWKEYGKWKEIIIKKLQMERIAECKLIHGAGAGGTTLSKRLMWDIKDITPTLRIRKFSLDTVNVIIDIYRKTGKCVFVVLEMGSTIVSEDEFEILKRKVNAQSCHALFLKVERTASKDGDEGAEIYLSEDLKETDAKKFYNTYFGMTDDTERRKNLTSITYDYIQDEWRGQCCPFFYGFYTFQDEYQGLGRFLKMSVARCNEGIKSILADISIMTIYSQNICMPYMEIAQRLDIKDVNLVEIFRKLDEGIEKILVQRATGFRICHPLIARKLLELIYDDYKYYNEQLYYATMDFIENINSIYEELDREYIDKVFKELVIDRSYIDGEQQKFALLINDLDKHSSKIKIFEKLIQLYEDNPHYYNHLGRLEIYEEKNMQFDKAVVHLKKALSIAEINHISQVPHYTTLGCIYSKKILSEMEVKERSIRQLLEIIAVDFGNANDCFMQARKIKENSTYAYFPNILMVCNIVKKMTKVTRQNLQVLLEDDMFGKWYNYYSGIAIQLFEQMKRNCDEELSDELKKKAEGNILYLKERVDVLKAKLLIQRKSGIKLRECNNLGRTISMLLYMQNNFKWEDMEDKELCFVEAEMERILEGGEYNQNDIIVWFNTYRQLNNFDIDKAKRYLLDYMEETYYKNYLLWLLSFLEYEKGILAYSQVESYLNACRYSNQLVENNIRTTRNVDAYTVDKIGFPIKKVGGLKNAKGKYLNLKTFTGQIIEIDGTVKGKIQMDGLDNIVVTFAPSFTVDDQKREFTRNDITSRVEFNLVFTYSGYKAFNPKKI